MLHRIRLLLIVSLCLPPMLEEVRSDEPRSDSSSAVSDAHLLYQLVQQTRQELQQVRKRAGVPVLNVKRSVSSQESREGEHNERSERGERSDRGEPRRGREGRGERRERRTEHSERRNDEHQRREGGEESQNRISPMTIHSKVYQNGLKLDLQYNPITEAFWGSVGNTTDQTVPQVRVEIHLSNGTELGPTQRIDLAAGETIPVELSAVNQSFRYWITHPESGNDEHAAEEGENHNEDGEREGQHRESRDEGSEHGAEGSHEAGGNRPLNATLRPLFNQLQLLRGEIKAMTKIQEARQRKQKG